MVFVACNQTIEHPIFAVLETPHPRQCRASTSTSKHGMRAAFQPAITSILSYSAVCEGAARTGEPQTGIPQNCCSADVITRKMADNVKVAVRVRPFNKREIERDASCVITMNKATQQTAITNPAPEPGKWHNVTVVNELALRGGVPAGGREDPTRQFHCRIV